MAGVECSTPANVGLFQVELCSFEALSKLREILEKLPLLRKGSDGTPPSGRREANELAGASSRSRGSGERQDQTNINSSPRIQMSLNRAMFGQEPSIQATPIKHLNPGFFINNDSSDSLENTETKINGRSYHAKHSFPNVGSFCHQTPQQNKKLPKKPTVFSPTLIKPDASTQPPPTLTMAASSPSPQLDARNNKQLLLLKLLMLLKAGSTNSTNSLQ
jgi:hypothetical protein